MGMLTCPSRRSQIDMNEASVLLESVKEIDLPQIMDRLADDFDVSFCDARLSQWNSAGFALKNKIINGYSQMAGFGIGIRVLSRGAWGFSSTTERSFNGIMDCGMKAARLAKKARIPGSDFKISDSIHFEKGDHTLNDKNAIPVESIVKLFHELDDESRLMSPKIKNAILLYSGLDGTSWVVNSRGCDVIKTSDSQFISTAIIASDGSDWQSGNHRVGFVPIIKQKDMQAIRDSVQFATSQSLRLLGSIVNKPGVYPLVVDAELGGIFVHESVGHACEADCVLIGDSIFENKMDQQIASEIVTIYDDGLLEGGFGYNKVDAEGIKCGNTTLIENGILRGFMHDISTSSTMEKKPTGNGRSESFSNMPIVRMTNTMLKEGNWKADELIAETKDGIYAKGWQYGYVEPASGRFQFKCKEAQLIEHGKLTNILRDCVLTGNIAETLFDVDAICRDNAITAGHCGKEGQFVRVSDGGPHFRIRKILIGGY